MSISALANTALSSLLTATQSTQSGQGKFQQVQSEFQQLGQDLQAGNLTQAQQDYLTLSQNFPNAQTATATSTATSSNPIAQAFTALQQDLEQFSAGGASGSTTGTSSSSSQANGSGLNVTA
jgi:outer membrane protein assembly factor BamD (BamD/ComL family)